MTKWYMSGVIALALGAGCGEGTDSFEDQATAIEQASAALTESDDADMDAVSEGREPKGDRGRGRADRREHRRRGFGHLLAHADPEALMACREEAQLCRGSADDTCRPGAGMCIREALTEAIEVLCADGLSMCAEDSAPERPCARIERHCDATDGISDTDTDDTASPDTDDDQA